MTPQDRERLEILSEALARMVRRQQRLEERLDRLEMAMGVAAPEVAPAPPVVAREAPTDPQPPPPAPPVEAPTLPAPRAIEEPSLESTFGLTWISRIGALTLVIGVAFFFKYAFENHWITETGRVLLGAGLALAALAAGERFWRTEQRTYGQALTATGIAFLYLSLWAAYSLYHLLSQPATFALMAASTAAAGGLSLRYQARAVAALGLIGGYVTPLLLDTGRAPWFVLGYTLLLAIGAVRLARQWTSLEPLALAGTILLYLTQVSAHDGERLGFVLLTLALYTVFAGAQQQSIVASAQVAAGIAIADAAGAHSAGYLPRLLLAAAGLGVAHRRNWPWLTASAFLGLWAAEPDLMRGHDEPTKLIWLTAAWLLFLAYSAWRASAPIDFALLVLNAAVYYSLAMTLMRQMHFAHAGLFTVAVAGVHMGAAWCNWQRQRRFAILASGVAWVLLVLAVPVQFSGYRVTAVWALQGAALAWIGSQLRERLTGLGALAIFSLVMIRLLAIDSWIFPAVDYTPFLNARCFTFAVSAAAMWAAAWWSRAEWPAAAQYVAGHFALTWGLCLEVSAWAARTAAPETVTSVQSLAISILLAAYAVAMVAGGVMQRSALTRMLGIGLIGFVVLKLYIYDVWFLGLFYRMAAFAVLGVLLLAMSYLYSRYRSTIDAWWRTQ